MGYFLCGLEEANRVVNVHLDCVFSNLIGVSKMSVMDMGVRRNFSRGGAKSTFCLSFCGFWRCNANWRIQKRYCPMLRQQLHTVLSL